MIIPPRILVALQDLRVDVVISPEQAAGFGGQSALIRSVRRKAAEQLIAAAATYAVDLHPADIIFSPIGITDGPLAGSTRWRCSWAPSPVNRAVLSGGPRDGEELTLPARQMFLVFLVNPPRYNYQPHPLVRVPEPFQVTYVLAGYDPQRRFYSYKFQ